MWIPPKPPRPSKHLKPPKKYIRVRTNRPTRGNIIAAARDHDEDWEPTLTNDFHPTDAPSGSPEKVEVLRQRVELGQPLWHAKDRADYSGLGVVKMLFVDERHCHGQG